MSAYCTVSEVQSEFNELNINSGSLDSSEITRFIEEESGKIDTKLSKRYTLPITSSEGLLQLKKICIDFVANRICKILNIAPITVSPDTNIEKKNGYYTAYEQSEKFLNRLSAGIDFLENTKTKNLGGLAYVTASDDDVKEAW